MKISTLLEVQAEFIPRDRSKNTADGIARQFINAAQYKARGNPKATRELAQKLANRFHSDVLAAIDQEMNYTQMKDFNEVA